MRRLLRDRWSTAAAVMVAALGTGLNTAVFAFVYGVLLQPLPYRDAVHLGVVDLSVPFDRVEAWRRQLSTFEQIAGYAREGVTVRGLTELRFVPVAAVSDTFFETLGTPPLAGRTFGDSVPVAVLSESAARAVMPDQDPVGRPLPMALPGSRERGHATVLGVIADVKYSGLESTAGPAVYVLWKDLPAGQLYLAVRTQGDPRATASALRGVLRAVDPRLPLMPVRGLSDVMQRSAADRRLRALLGGGMALLAFAIAVVGLAGGLGRLVAERRRELAIRAALGATPSRALETVMRDGAILAAAGITAGTLITLVSGTWLRSLVHGVSPHDPVTLCAVAGIVAAVSLLACYLPARQAATANPLDALRDN